MEFVTVWAFRTMLVDVSRQVNDMPEECSGSNGPKQTFQPEQESCDLADAFSIERIVVRAKALLSR